MSTLKEIKNKYLKFHDISESEIGELLKMVAEETRTKDQLLIAANIWEDRFKKAEAQLEAVRKLPDEWVHSGNGHYYGSDCAKQLQAILEDKKWAEA